MKVLFRYTMDMVRRNKHTSFSIMAAILLASTLLCTLCIYGYTQWQWQIDIEEHLGGTWHGELGGFLTKEDLELVDHNLKVEQTMVKGPFFCVKLPEGNFLPYLLVRDLDDNYWREMGDRNAVMDGRVPEKPGEIAVSKSFFDRNPQYRIGDTLTFPVGERWLNGENLENGVRQEGEEFRQTGEMTLTLVGKLDITTPTTTPGYYAMGFLERSSLAPDDELVIYLKMRDIRDTYIEMPLLAEAVGLEKNEYGRYENNFRYHSRLLALNGVFDPEQPFNLMDYANKAAYAVLILLAAGAFVLIIHSAFALSANARGRQLGMFRSIGATPGQIRLSILFEGLILSAVPIPLSLGLGYLLSLVIYRIYSGILGDLLYYPVTLRFSLPLAAVAALLSLGTVLFSAFLPARRIAKKSPIEAIRAQEGSARLKKAQAHPIFQKLFGFQGELAASSYTANRRAFRASVTALTICLVLTCMFSCTIRLNDLITGANQRERNYNISGRLQTLDRISPVLLEEVFSVPGIQEGTHYSSDAVSLWVTPSEESPEFKSNGGFASIDQNMHQVIDRDGKYRIRAIMTGMETAAFDEYCRSAGQDPAEYSDPEHPRALAVSWAPKYPDSNLLSEIKQFYPLLNLSAGQVLELEEKTSDSMDTDYRFQITVGAVAEQLPELDYWPYDYCVMLYFPEETYYAIVENFKPEYSSGVYRKNLVIKTAPENDLAVTEQVRKLCEANIATEDVNLRSAAEEVRDNQVTAQAMRAVANCLGLLLGLIGISNAFAAVTHSLRQRRKEFAMLRSVGMDSRGIRRLLWIEGMRMMLSPVLLGIPIALLLCTLLLWTTKMSWGLFLPYFPTLDVLVSAAAIMLAVGFAYWLSTRKIQRDTIIDAIREETV